MRIHTKLLLAIFTAALVLSMGAAAANAARSFSVINNTLLTYVSPGLTFVGSPGGNSVICLVTLTASLHPVIAKVRNTLVGFVNGGRAEGCINSLGTAGTRAIALVSHRLPWHITLINFRGTLPRITEILVILNDVKFLLLVREPFARLQGCLYRGAVEVETRGRTGREEYTIELIIVQPLNVIPLFDERLNESLAACERTGELRGVFHANLPPIVRLI